MGERLKMETVMGALLLAAAFLLATGGMKQAAAEVQGTGRTVVIDAGHGGDDPGKVGVGGTLEKDVNLAVAQKLADCLKKEGIRPVMTREDEKGLYRPEAANKKQDDMKNRCAKIDGEKPLFTVSIHQNSYTEEAVHGPQVFYYAHSKEAEELAGYIQDAMNEDLADRPREKKANDTYYLLKKTKSPTVIVECGFLSNREEEAKLVTEEYQQKVAESVCRGIMGYLKEAKNR